MKRLLDELITDQEYVMMTAEGVTLVTGHYASLDTHWTLTEVERPRWYS